MYAGTIIDAGPVGAGAGLKLAVNVMTYAQSAAGATVHDIVDGTGGRPAALLEAWQSMGQLVALTEKYWALLGIPSERIAGGLRVMLKTQASIIDKDLSLALEFSNGGTRPGTAAVLEVVRAAIPAVYNVHKTPEEPE